MSGTESGQPMPLDLDASALAMKMKGKSLDEIAESLGCGGDEIEAAVGRALSKLYPSLGCASALAMAKLDHVERRLLQGPVDPASVSRELVRLAGERRKILAEAQGAKSWVPRELFKQYEEMINYMTLELLGEEERATLRDRYRQTRERMLRQYDSTSEEETSGDSKETEIEA